MNIHCPYCFSENVVRVVREQPVNGGSGNHMAASATFATLGASLSKSLPVPVPPVVGGIAGAVVGGLLGSLFRDSTPANRNVPVRYFHCQNCQQDFQ